MERYHSSEAGDANSLSEKRGSNMETKVEPNEGGGAESGRITKQTPYQYKFAQASSWCNKSRHRIH
jgi:hypothetical protein